MKLLRDTWLIFQRSITQNLRQPTWLLIGLLQPVLYLVLFGPLLERVSQGPGFPAGGAWNVFVPGLIVQMAMFAGAFAGFSLVAQIRLGVLERFRVTPVSRTALLFGMALRDVVVLLVQSVILIVIAIPFGLRIDAAGALVALMIVGLIGLAIGSGSYVIALKTKSEEAIAPITNTLFVPLLLLSGALLPMALAPDWLQTVANANPLLHGVEGIRAVFRGDPGNSAVVIAFATFGALAAFGLWGARRVFGRMVS